MGAGCCIGIVGDIKIVAGIESVDCVDAGPVLAGSTLDVLQELQGVVEVGLDLVIDCLDGGAGGLLLLVVLDNEGNAELGCSGSGLVGLAEMAGKVEVAGCTEEVGFAQNDLGVGFELFIHVACGCDEDVVVLDCAVVCAPVVLHVVVAGGEVVVGLVDAAVVVAKVDGSVEAIHLDFTGDGVFSHLAGSEGTEQTVLECGEVGLGLDQAGVLIVGDGTDRIEVQVAGSKQGD